MCRPKTTFNPIAEMFTDDDFKVMSKSELYDIEYELKNSAYKLITINKNYWGRAICLRLVDDLNGSDYDHIRTSIEGFNNTSSKQFFVAYIDVLERIKPILGGDK